MLALIHGWRHVTRAFNSGVYEIWVLTVRMGMGPPICIRAQNKNRTNGNFMLELDFEPFNVSSPCPTLSKSIGNGVEFLNRHLSVKCFMTEIACTLDLIFSKHTTTTGRQ